MAIHQIEVRALDPKQDPVRRQVLSEARAVGIATLRDVSCRALYLLQGELDEAAARRLAAELLHDPVTETFECRTPDSTPPAAGAARHVVNVFRKPGVMDPVEASALEAIRDLGHRLERVRTGRKYILEGELSSQQLDRLAGKVLSNPVIDEVVPGEVVFREIRLGTPYVFRLVTVPLLGRSEAELLQLNHERTLSLTLAEMRAIEAYFRRAGREPTDVELETLAQTWSEHCKHKTLTGKLRMEGEVIDNLLRSTIMRVTRELARPWCLSVFKDNAGIIEFDERFALCFKVETHNHPSAVEPYGGAGTGVGGVIRDCLGCGLGAQPILNTDVFCVAPLDLPAAEVPPGAIPPRRLLRGVVAGVRDYGNRMGIPTANGAVYFDPRYVGNPLVYCGTLGVMPREACHKEPKPGDTIVVVGGRTGRDGIHGVTFSSVRLDETSEEVSATAVQIGNAITEKKMVDAILQARERGLYNAITDCGGGGLSSAVGEMGELIGAEVELEKIPLKYDGLNYSEIWISEAQERMVLSVPPGKLEPLLKLCADEDVEATAIGRFVSSGRLLLRYQGNVVGDLEMSFLHHGLPALVREAAWSAPASSPFAPELRREYTSILLKLLGAWNVCSKEWIIRQYDHEVQGMSVLKPLQGKGCEGPGDACVIRPVPDSTRAVAISNGMAPRLGDIDPYAMAACAIDEAVRNAVAVGAAPDRIALLDNFCWGAPDEPAMLGALVRAATACYDVALAYGTPFISGKDSLHNEFRTADRVISIPHSLLISAVGLVPDLRSIVSMALKGPGALVYLVGETREELAGTEYQALGEGRGGTPPRVDTSTGPRVMQAVARAIREGLVRACHDCSEGGLAVAAAEMAFSGGIGLRLDLGRVPSQPAGCSDPVLLFSESPSRFLVEVASEAREHFERFVADVPHACIGETLGESVLRVEGREGGVVVEASLEALKKAWQEPLYHVYEGAR